MKLLNKRNLMNSVESLIEKPLPLGVSIYFPTSAYWTASQQGKIRLKNLITKSKEIMYEKKIPDRTIKNILKPAEDIIDDEEFWRNRNLGTALFLSDGTFELFSLPFEVEEILHVEEFFNLKTISRFFFEDTDYFVLSVDKCGSVLYKVEDGKAVKIEHGSIGEGKDINEVLRLDDPEKQIQFHSTTRGGSGGIIFHGQGSLDDTRELFLESYLREIDREVNRVLSKYTLPMVFAGDEKVFYTYKHISEYPNLLDGYVRGNPKGFTEDKLLKTAWELVQENNKRYKDKKIDQFHSLTDTERFVCKIEDLVRSSFQMRVDTILLDPDSHIWGTYDELSNHLTLSDEHSPDYYDLVNYSLIYTLRGNGAVVTTSKNRLGTGVGAILRF